MIFSTELRRGTAPLAAIGTAIGLTWVLCVHPDEWSGRWTLFAGYLRVALLILAPLLVAAGAWQGGRERRRDLDELLSTTARPSWQPALVAWAAVTLGGTIGVALPLAVVAVLVGRVATYAGGGWWWTLAVGLLALWPATALGFLAGRLIPLRVVAPIAGLATYLGLAVPLFFNGSPLTPVFGFVTETETWSPGFHAWQAAWLLTITAALLLIAERRWIGAAMPAVALTALYVIAPSNRSYVDRGAAALVCTTTGPQVCVTRENAFLLDDVARIGQPILTKVAGIPGAPTRAIDRSSGVTPGPDTVALELTRQAKIDGTLFHPRYLRFDLGQMVYATDCPSPDDDRVYRTQRLAETWLTGDARRDEPIEQLRALPPQRQRTWFEAYLAALHRCDTAALITLGDPR